MLWLSVHECMNNYTILAILTEVYCVYVSTCPFSTECAVALVEIPTEIRDLDRVLVRALVQ
jgi:hypothetical protein